MRDSVTRDLNLSSLVAPQRHSPAADPGLDVTKPLSFDMFRDIKRFSATSRLASGRSPSGSLGWLQRPVEDLVDGVGDVEGHDLPHPIRDVVDVVLVATRQDHLGDA